MLRLGVTITVFAVAWLLWSGHYTAILLSLGAVSCGLAIAVAVRIGFFERDVYTLDLGLRLPAFWLWLLKEITIANIAVARIVLSHSAKAEPVMISIDARHLPPTCQAILANAITLTPGTLSLDVNGGTIKVHCLTAGFAEALREGEMLRRVETLIER